ncbi:YdeI/OmpD-associated family protein [Ilumatobacter sp.]|uniref:YdeI/OmpD-associated family protein n=1 Tax=Ilumatobacter sp. TaxID=1967498 RepID=UPI003B52B052
MSTSDIERITAADSDEFRAWLHEHHETADAVWLIYFRKDSDTPSITWSEAVDEALCYGWIDSKIQSLDNDRYEQYFCPHKPTSPWSKVNKTKIAALQDADRIQPAGAAAIERAKANGSWTILDDAENHIVPDDLADALDNATTRDNFDQLPPSTRRNILQWIVLAKRDDTRQRRIQQTADAAANGETPNNL